MDFSKRMQLVNKHSVFGLEKGECLVWCDFITKADDGMFYLYFSFWPRNKGHKTRVTHSKIGFAVADNPLVFLAQICWADGRIETLQCMERPQMWLDETAQPKVLSCVCARPGDRDRIHAFNVQIGIE